MKKHMRRGVGGALYRFFVYVVLIPVGHMLVTGCTARYVVNIADLKRGRELAGLPTHQLKAPNLGRPARKSTSDTVVMPAIIHERALTKTFGTIARSEAADAADCKQGGRWLLWGSDDGANGGVSGDGILQVGETRGRSLICEGSIQKAKMVPRTTAPAVKPSALPRAKPNKPKGEYALPVRDPESGNIAYIPVDKIEKMAISEDGSVALIDVSDNSPIFYGIGGFMVVGGVLLLLLAIPTSEFKEGKVFGTVGLLYTLLGGGLIGWGVAIDPEVSNPWPRGGWTIGNKVKSASVVPGVTYTGTF
jgi:hypothetical protein